MAVQADARGLMLEKMAEFGLAGQVEMTRTGQMVIQIGEDGASQPQMPDRPVRPRGPGNLPELFTADGAVRANLPRLALEADVPCPEIRDPALMRANPVLATSCMVEELRTSGQFEYVEKDWIFDHQFIRRPSEPPVRIPVEPNDALWSLQWHFFNNGTGAGQSPGGAGFVDFWTDKGTTGSRDVVVAVIDTGLDILVTQANSAGTLETVGDITADINAIGAFDIEGYSGNAFVVEIDVVASPNRSRFWSLNLATGEGSFIGEVGGGQIVTALAVVPEPSSLALLSLAGLGLLRRRR